jgi:TPR repeat protein
MFRLGWMYARGDGVEKDEKEAFRWYHKAADKGHKGAKDALERFGE